MVKTGGLNFPLAGAASQQTGIRHGEHDGDALAASGLTAIDPVGRDQADQARCSAIAARAAASSPRSAPG